MAHNVTYLRPYMLIFMISIAFLDKITAVLNLGLFGFRQKDTKPKSFLFQTLQRRFQLRPNLHMRHPFPRKGF